DEHARTEELQRRSELVREPRLDAGQIALVFRERRAEVHRAHDRARIAPLPLAPDIEHTALLRERLGRDERHVPAIGVARDHAQEALLAAAADPDARPRLHRLWLAVRIAQVEVATRERGLLLLEQAADDAHRLVELRQPLADRQKGDAIGLELGLV